jgi:hypothetical protein
VILSPLPLLIFLFISQGYFYGLIHVGTVAKWNEKDHHDMHKAQELLAAYDLRDWEREYTVPDETFPKDPLFIPRAYHGD